MRMKRLASIAIIGMLAWNGYSRFQEHELAMQPAEKIPQAVAAPISERRSTSFSCDGRTYCSQMTSCDEATYFIQHCPGTKMDGDHDGVPCERQWCR